MADRAHIQTDKEIARIQRHIAGIYRDAQKDVEKDLIDYAKTVKEKSDKLLKAVDDAEDEQARKDAEAAYKRFFLVDVKKDRRFKKTVEKASERLYDANKEVAKYINTKTAKIYALNYNQIGSGLQKDLDGYKFKPVSESDAEDYGQITQQEVDKRRDESWNRKNVVSAVVSGALLMYGVEKIFTQAAQRTVQKNLDGGNRQASDTLADAESKGRLDSMYRAYDEGFEVQKYWIATLDNRTRATHIEYDGLDPVPLDYEYAPGLKKPKDPDCTDLSEVCNCRCSLQYYTGHARSQTRAAREGEVTGSYKNPSSFDDTKTISVPNMSYEEWMKWRSP